MNYYDILGVDRKVDAKELKRAYKALAHKWHLDLNPDKVEVARIDYDKKLDAESANSPAFTNRFTAPRPKTKEVTNEDKLNTFARERKKKNPLDTTDFYAVD